MKRRLLNAAAMLTMAAVSGSTALFAQPEANDPPGSGTITATTVTNVTATIAQLNYGADGNVNGFLIGTNTLLTFPAQVTGGIASLGSAGNSVTYSGMAATTTSGFESVRVSSFTNNTTKATYTAATSIPTPTTYGPATGTVKQLNYDPQGNIDGFLFLTTGSTTAIVVVTGPQASATLKPLLTVGGSVSVTGLAETADTNPCASSGALKVVDATSLTISGQTIVIAGGGFGGGRPGGPGGPGGPHR